MKIVYQGELSSLEKDRASTITIYIVDTAALCVKDNKAILLFWTKKSLWKRLALEQRLSLGPLCQSHTMVLLLYWGIEAMRVLRMLAEHVGI
jgi:hypothetical protein